METQRAAFDPIDARLLGPLFGAAAVTIAGAVVLALFALGPMSTHMALHIASMNIAAPLAAIGWRSFHPASASPNLGLWPATLIQLAVLWAWHSPTLQNTAHTLPTLAAAFHVALFLSALVFWLAVVDAVPSRWQAILALLVTGKLACLIGALLIFAPRLLYEASSHDHVGHGVSVDANTALADQHLAGLLMIAACPLSFILTAIVLAAQALAALRRFRPTVLPGSHRRLG
jgi:putative membrane protein